MDSKLIFSDTFFSLGTRCDVVFSGIDERKAKHVFRLVKEEVDQLESILDPYSDNSALAQLNKSKKKNWISIPIELMEILSICYDFYEMSNGAFDISMAPLVEYWKNNADPGKEDLADVKQICGMHKADYDFEGNCIKKHEENLCFDPGALKKEIALDSVKPLLTEYGINNAIVSFGENSVLAIGHHPYGDPWPIGIRSKYNVNDFVQVFSASDQNIATAGYLHVSDEHEAEKRQFIISPASGTLVDNNKSVSVKAESAILAKFLAMVWLILPENDKLLLSDKFKNVEILEVSYKDSDYSTKLTIL